MTTIVVIVVEILIHVVLHIPKSIAEIIFPKFFLGDARFAGVGLKNTVIHFVRHNIPRKEEVKNQGGNDGV